ncbi:MAG: hypothetical protein IIB17_03720 [Chloroflexi bacterium]|nr:hypothetical protein [Chloroflexota bacterium]
MVGRPGIVAIMYGAGGTVLEKTVDEYCIVNRVLLRGCMMWAIATGLFREALILYLFFTG